MTARTAQARLQELAEDVVAGGVDGVVLRVEAKGQDVAVDAAAGIARADTAAPVTTAHRFHVASVGKMFTGTLVLRAAAEGRFGPAGIDTALGDLQALLPLPAGTLHPQGAQITLRHLLTHTSGLRDIQVDDASATSTELGHPAAGSVAAHFAASATRIARGDEDDGFAHRRWTPAAMLQWYLDAGAGPHPVGAPGERFHYSDTAYVLLGMLTEAATGRPYHHLQREWILEPLGLAHTYLAYHDDPTPDARAQEMDIRMDGLPLLSLGLDVSFDWSGGGQVSTTADLCRFLPSVLTPERQEWVRPPGLRDPFLALGLGLLRFRSGERELIGHAGAWGVANFQDPTTGAVMAGTVGRPDPRQWVVDVFDIVDDELS